MVRARGAVVVDDRLERFDPLLRLGGVGIVVEDFVEPVHRGALRRGPLAAQWSWNQNSHSIRGSLRLAGAGGTHCSSPGAWRPRAGRCPRFGERHAGAGARRRRLNRSEEHTSELQSLMRISHAVFCLKQIKTTKTS